jgi:hypothetical protein
MLRGGFGSERLQEAAAEVHTAIEGDERLPV